MPKAKIPSKSNICESDCEKVKSMADEYLHDELIIFGAPEDSRELELSDKDRSFVDSHIGQCAGCLGFIESESGYIDAMAQARHIPEASVSEFVARKIAEGGITVEKPKKRIFVPFGLISAAAIVLAVFIASRGGALDIFTKSNDRIASNSQNFAAADEGGAEIFAAPEMAFGAYDADEAYEAYDDFHPAEAPAPAPAPEAAEAEQNQRDDSSDAWFWEANPDLAVEWLYRIYLGGAAAGDILGDIEIYRADPAGGYYVVGLQYLAILEKNISKSGVSAEADAAFNPNAENKGEKYIGILIY